MSGTIPSDIMAMLRGSAKAASPKNKKESLKKKEKDVDDNQIDLFDPTYSFDPDMDIDEELPIGDNAPKGRSSKKNKKAAKKNDLIENIETNEKSPKKKHKKAKKDTIPKPTEEEYRSRLIELISYRDFLRGRLAELNPHKRKGAQATAEINNELMKINLEINRIQQESGIKMSELDNGSKVSRVWNTIKSGAKKVFKKVRKFFKRNMETILSIAAIIVPVILGATAAKAAAA